MKNNKVSIIIPTKNNGDIIEKCLASIKKINSRGYTTREGWRILLEI